MASSAEPGAGELLSRVARFASEGGLFSSGERVVVAFSGGPDSSFLLEALSRAGLRLAVAHLDHSIRPESSDDAAFCEERARHYGVPFLSRREDVPTLAKAARKGIETAARDARRRFLRAAAEGFGAKRIATGHTLTDAAETTLMNLFRGAGIRGLVGIRASAPPLVRPLLCATRREVRAACCDLALPTLDDPTNETLDTPRNFVRNAVLAGVLERFPHAERGYARAHDALAAIEDLLAERYEPLADLLAAEGDTLDARALAVLPRALAARVLINRFGLDSRETRRALATLPRSGEVPLRGGRRLVVSAGRVALDPVPLQPIPLTELRGTCSLPRQNLRLSVERAVTNARRLSAPVPAGPLFVRSVRRGDRVDGKPAGRLMNAARVPAWLRGGWPLVLVGEEPYWLVGIRHRRHRSSRWLVAGRLSDAEPSVLDVVEGAAP